MDLQYDIDIFYIMPPEAFSDPAAAAMMQGTGMTLNSRGNYIAKFRDPRTVAALAGASDNVKAFFKASGFAFVPSGVSLPDGVFDQTFENHLTDVAKRMQENIQSFDLKDQDWNGFNLGTCILTLGHVTPVDVSNHPAKKPRERARWKPLKLPAIHPQLAFLLLGAITALAFEYMNELQVSSSTESVQTHTTDR